MLDQEIREQEVQERVSAAPVKPAPRGLIVLAVVLVLALIGAVAWALAERNDAGDVSTELTAAEARIGELEADLTAAQAEIADLAESGNVLVAGGGPLTARQHEMVELVTGPWSEAWKAGDGDAAAGFFTPDGVMYDFEGGGDVTVADGTIQTFASQWTGLEHLPGMLVDDDRIVTVVKWRGAEAGIIVEFTRSGELLVESVAMYDSVLRARPSGA